MTKQKGGAELMHAAALQRAGLHVGFRVATRLSFKIADPQGITRMVMHLPTEGR